MRRAAGGIMARAIVVLVGSGCTFGSSGGDGVGTVADDVTSTTAADDGVDAATDTNASAFTGGADTSTTAPADTSAGSSGGTTSGVGPATSETTAGDESSTGRGLSCERVLWVLGDLNVMATADALFYARLVTVGYDVTLVLNADSSPDDIGDHCVVVLSAVGSSGDVAGKFRDVTVPVVVMEAYLYDEMQMVQGGNGVTNPVSDIDIVDPGHPLAAGLAGNVTVYGAGAEIGWGVVAPTAAIVATMPFDANQATIFGYDAGSMMSGLQAPARRVGFPASGNNGTGPTQDALDLFEAAVGWAVQ